MDDSEISRIAKAEYYGDKKMSREYSLALSRIELMTREEKFEYKNEYGIKRKGSYYYIADYSNKEKDLEILGMRELPERLERYTKAKAGDKRGYIDASLQMEEDKEYIENNNGKYNQFATTQKNLRTLGSWGEKTSYMQIQKGQVGRNILRRIGNVGLFIRNYTVRPVYGAIGKYIVAPIHKSIVGEDSQRMYKNRPLHRYEARKEYLQNAGNNFFMSRIKAVANYREINEKIIQERIDTIKRKELESIAHKKLTTAHLAEIERLRKENQIAQKGKYQEKYANWGSIEQEIKDKQKKIEEYQKKLANILKEKDVIGGEAISQRVHEKANKVKITRATSAATLLAGVGVKKLINHLAQTKVQPDIQPEINNDEGIIIYEQSGKPCYPDGTFKSDIPTGGDMPRTGVQDASVINQVNAVNTRQEQIRQLTLGDYMTLADGQKEVPLQYAVKYGKQKNFPVDAIKYPRGITYETKKGILSMADGNGFDINGYANFLTDRQLTLEDNLWDTLAELLNKAGKNITGENLCERFTKLNPEQQMNFLSKVDITVGNELQGIPLGHLDGAKSSIAKIVEDIEFGN